MAYLDATMLAGSVYSGVPQVLRIWRARSAQGMSEAAIAIDLSCSFLSIFFNIQVGMPFRQWLEAVSVLASQMVLICLIWWFSPGLNRIWRAAALIAGIAILVQVGYRGPPPILLWSIGIYIWCCPWISLPAQLLKNFRQKHTGVLAIIPAILGLGGKSIRTLTGFARAPSWEAWAVMMWVHPFTVACLQAMMVYQIIHYRPRTVEVLNEMRAAQAEAEKDEMIPASQAPCGSHGGAQRRVTPHGACETDLGQSGCNGMLQGCSADTAQRS